jgi:hypothetical protein
LGETPTHHPKLKYFLREKEKIDMEKEIKVLHYFAVDGNYGDASSLTIIDTTDWTDEDFSYIEGVRDYDLPFAARAISEWIEKGRGNSEQDPESFAHFDKFGIEYEWKD